MPGSPGLVARRSGVAGTILARLQPAAAPHRSAREGNLALGLGASFGTAVS